MKVSAKSEYAVRAMVYLARSFGQGPVPLSQVAEREHIPLDFLEQVMLLLRNAGLVQIDRKKITVFDPLALAKRFS